ncbi:MAG: FUSC family protein [Solirubrobacterales bacterium]
MKLAISDPGKFALKNAIRAAIVVPAAFAISLEVVGLTEMALFAGFGSIALLVFVDFGGSWRQRLGAYLMLVGGGAILIAIGTLCSQTTWLAVGAMAITAFTIVFAGILDGYVAAAQSAAILAFVLALMVPAASAAIPTRLAGWALAAAFSIAATFLLWPRRSPDRLREGASQAVGALADLVGAVATFEADKREIRGAVAGELAGLAASANLAVSRAHREFVVMPHRPSGVGGRLAALGRLVDDLVSFDPIAREQPAPAATSAGFAGERAVVEASVAAALQIASRRLADDDPGDGGEELAALATAHTDVGRAFLAKASAAGGDIDEESLTAELDEVFRLRMLAYGALQIGRHALQASGATAPADPSLAPNTSRLRFTRRLASSHSDMRSVWLRNSLRTAAGLALAVLVARVTDTQNGFWVVLGTMSVLRSSALATGSTALEAIAGTVVGIVAGGLIVLAIGGQTGLLWAVLPFSILLAAYSPRAISFAAGQAGFTTAVVVLFNLIEPVGWTVGVVRIEDVAIGCAVSLATGLLLWPRGAAEVLREALGATYVLAARYLDLTISSLLKGGESGTVEEAGREASEAALRLDETVREYLAENSSARENLDGLAQLIGGATRVRRVARLLQSASILVPLAPLDAHAPWVSQVCNEFDTEWRSRRAWFELFGTAIAAGAEPPLPESAAQAKDAGASSRLWGNRGPGVRLDRGRGPSRGAVPPGLAIAWAERHLETLLNFEPDLALAARSVLGGSSDTGHNVHDTGTRLTQLA